MRTLYFVNVHETIKIMFQNSHIAGALTLRAPIQELGLLVQNCRSSKRIIVMVHGTAHPQRETKCSVLHQSGEQLHGPNAITYNCEGTLVRNEAFQGSF